MPGPDAVTVRDDRGLDVCCVICGNRQFIASLLLPGGLRLRCTACGKTYSSTSLAAMTDAIADSG